MDDSRRLYAWHCDEDTRANSRRAKPASPEEHLDWMKRNVDPGNREQVIIIAEDKDGPFGMIRFSGRDGDNFEVGIVIAPERRGDGLGGKMLSEACGRMKGFLVAEIKSTNLASRKIFEKCGFEWISEHGGYMLYRRPRRDETV
jgi:RimJ/RimL family protein N-acetyltransferase